MRSLRWLPATCFLACSSFGGTPGATDAGIALDAGTSAAVDGGGVGDAGDGAAPPGACLLPYDFCTTFDEGSEAPAPWAKHNGKGVVSLDPTQHANGAGSLHARIDPGETLGPGLDYFLPRDTWTKAVVRFSFLIRALPQPGELQVLNFLIGTNHSVFWAITDHDSGLGEIDGGSLHAGGGPIVPLDTWLRCRFDLDIAAGTASLRYESESASVTPISVVTRSPTGSILTIGIPVTPAVTDGADVWFDDVQLSLSP